MVLITSRYRELTVLTYTACAGICLECVFECYESQLLSQITSLVTTFKTFVRKN